MVKNNKVKKLLLLTNYVLFLFFLFFAFWGYSKKLVVFNRSFSISFWISLISIPLFLFSYVFVWKNKTINYLLWPFLVVFSILSISTLSVCFFLFPQFNGYYNTNPFLVWGESLLKYLYDFFVIIYIFFFVQILPKKRLWTIVSIYALIWILIGLIQILIYYSKNSFISLSYDKLDFLDLLADSSVFLREGRQFQLYSFCAEPSVCFQVLTFIFIPFYSVDIAIHCGSPLKRVFDFIIISILLVFSVLTKSSATYICVAVACLASLFVFLTSKSISIVTKRAVIISTLSLVIIFLSIPEVRSSFINIAVEKVFSTTNYSTQHRYSTIWNDLVCFLKFPITGIGDELQGYFYFENIAGTWMSKNSETIYFLSGVYGLVAGGSLFFSLLSGFGIVGIATLTWATIYLFREEKARSYKVTKIKLFLIIAIPPMIVGSFVAMGMHRDYPLFILLALPEFAKSGIQKIDLDKIESFLDCESVLSNPISNVYKGGEYLI